MIKKTDRNLVCFWILATKREKQEYGKRRRRAETSLLYVSPPVSWNLTSLFLHQPAACHTTKMDVYYIADYILIVVFFVTGSSGTRYFDEWCNSSILASGRRIHRLYWDGKQ